MPSLSARYSHWLALAPSLALVGLLLGASVLYALAESFGYLTVIGERQLSFAAYRATFAADSEFWVSLAFSLWVSISATAIAALLAFLLAVWLSSQPNQTDSLLLNINLTIPHLVFAIGVLLLLSQSGWLARWAAVFGWIDLPEQFPLLVRDRFGLGIILHYVVKEIPFLTLMLLGVLQAQTVRYEGVAQNLGANRWQCLRYITFPQVLPALLAGTLLVFGYIFSSYEVPAILGVSYPRALPVLALRYFLDPDLRARAEGMVMSLVITMLVMVVTGVSKRLEQAQG
jgi:putative spermidine/putrescine transport system permease protein